MFCFPILELPSENLVVVAVRQIQQGLQGSVLQIVVSPGHWASSGQGYPQPLQRSTGGSQLQA